MTLEEFRATGRDVPDLGLIENLGAAGFGGRGRVYGVDGDLAIEFHCGGWCLTIGNSQRVASLAVLERDLYEFAVSEGYIA